MSFSFLFRTPEAAQVCDVNYVLSVDRIARAFCHDENKVKAFLRVTQQPLRRVENILYRQQLISDFIEYPELFDSLKTAFARYDRMQSDWMEMRSGIAPASADAGAEASLDRSFRSLKVTAIFPRTLMSFYDHFAEILSRYEIRSKALVSMRDMCLLLKEDRSLLEVVDIASRFQYYDAQDYSFTVLCELDERIRVCACDLTDIRSLRDMPKKKLFGFLQKDRKASDSSVTIGEDAVDGARRLISIALDRIDEALYTLTDAVYHRFAGLSSEMAFYDAALQICEALTEHNIPLCFPQPMPEEQDALSVRSLRDPFLVLEGMHGEQIVSNDITLPQRGNMLIRGGNSTGKTTFLRALGIAQIFCQAGLPVCAEEAQISVRNGIYAQFSSAEEDKTELSPAGRFEGEVREMAQIMDSVKPHSLVLLNETFQTTSYDEGARGMFDILCALDRIRCRFVFVTHLTGVFALAKEQGDRFMTFASGSDENAYRILPCE